MPEPADTRRSFLKCNRRLEKNKIRISERHEVNLQYFLRVYSRTNKKLSYR